MKKILIGVAGALALLATACSSLPESARKMTLNVDSVGFANQNNVEGFKVDYTVHHSSSEPMPIDEVKINVKVNGKLVAVYDNPDDTLMPNRRDTTFSVFVPANKTYTVSKNSLKTPMLQVQAVAEVMLFVDADEKSEEAAFNVRSQYKGIIHAATN